MLVGRGKHQKEGEGVFGEELIAIGGWEKKALATNWREGTGGGAKGGGSGKTNHSERRKNYVKETAGRLHVREKWGSFSWNSV